MDVPHYWTAEQVGRLLDQLADDNRYPARTAALIMWRSGLRVSEALNLEWRDLNYLGKPATLQVRQSKTRRGRTVRMHSELVQMFTNWPVSHSSRDKVVGLSMRTALQQIRYKADWYGTIIVAADRFYPSSKLCSDCGTHHASLGRELHWTCPQCGRRHDRNENAALNLLTPAINPARELGKLALGPVGPNVTLLDGKALANGSNASGETGPGEGRTALSTPASPAVDGGATPYGGSRSEVVINTQLQLAI